MRIDLSPNHSRLRLAGSLQALSTGLNNPAIEIHRLPYVGPGAAASEPLVTILLDRPPGSIIDGVLILQPLDPAGEIIARSGEAAWARFVDGTGAWVMDTDVGLEGSDTLVWLEDLTLRAGGRCPLVLSAIT